MYMICRHHFKVMSTILFAVCLFSCDSHKSGTASSSAVASSASSAQTAEVFPPLKAEDFGDVQVQFPPNFSRTANASISLRGLVLESADVIGLTVNGNAIDPADYGDWRLQVDLTEGLNSILIEATYGDNSVSSQSLTIYRDNFTFIATATDMVRNRDSGQLYVLDAQQKRVFTIAPNSQLATELSPRSTTNLLDSPTAMVLDIANNRLLVAQKSETPIVAIDLTTGDQLAIDVQVPDEITLLNRPTALALDGQYLYVADQEVIKVDITGNRLPKDSVEENAITVNPVIHYQLDLTDLSFRAIFQYQSSQNVRLLNITVGLTVNPISGEIYGSDAANGKGRLYAINIETGEPRLLSLLDVNGSVIPIPQQLDLAFDDDQQNLFLFGNNQLVVVDPESGLTLLVSSNSFPADQAILIRGVNKFVLGDSDDQILYFDDAIDTLVEIDTTTGLRKNVGDSIDLDNFVAVSDLLLDLNSDSLIAIDSRLATVFKIDLSTGLKSKIISSEDYQGDTAENNPILFPEQGVITNSGALLIFDSVSDSQTLSWTRIVSVRKNPDETYTAKVELELASDTIDVVYDQELQSVYLATNIVVAKFLYPAASTIDLQILSSYSATNPDAPFMKLRSLSFDETNQRLLAADSSVNAIVAVDLDTGTRSYFSSYATSVENGDDIELDQPKAIVVNPASSQAFIVDVANKAIVEMDTNDGSKKRWLDITEYSAEGLMSPKNLEIHPFFHYLLTFDEVSRQILAIDIATKQMVRVSH